MSWDIELAKELKKRDNKDSFGSIIGTVVSVSPVRISIFDASVLLDSRSLYLCDGNESMSYKVGDEVLLMPTSSEQNFFIMGKVIKL